MLPLRLTVVRHWFSPNSSLGELFIGDNYLTGKPFCYTLEDQVRPIGQKVAHETAIPYGTYDVEMTFSQKFGKVMPLIENVPGFEGIRIHSGNTVEDTSGCLLVGFHKDGQTISQSREAATALYQIILSAQDNGQKIEITCFTLEKRLLYIGLLALLTLGVLSLCTWLLIRKYKKPDQ